MGFLLPLTLAVLLTSPALRAADDRSPYDKNPACTDRKIDSSKEDCLIKDDGTPRHKYPPRATIPATPTTPPKAAAPSTAGGAILRSAPVAGGR